MFPFVVAISEVTEASYPNEQSEDWVQGHQQRTERSREKPEASRRESESHGDEQQ
ncbi:hypothetical protein NOR51B_2569 [Luminiphilus syltensis NOR5-1B]|uniref:Uncharacterized protein n=1 Tax=Luminiphilus syltensis NOR5-1B TaxID=565045 RepID=B8KVR0_9GAMM|nr:hypothetical protein NOR51B_2569 [Luminiphilus syltensis NOR5-1B]